MYDKIIPVTYHFYPLQHYTETGKFPFSEFLNELHGYNKSEYSENLIYLHIPYCENRCIFCPFHIYAKRDDAIYERYVHALECEIEALARLPRIQDMKFKAIFFGGGSPSLLSVPHIRRLYDALRRSFQIEDDAEWTFEGEPRSLAEPSLLSFLAEQQTNRISFGVQTFNEKLRKTLQLSTKLADVFTCYDRLRSFGFKEINIDLMFHLPGQSLKDLEEDIVFIDTYRFDSIDYYYMSYYSLAKRIFMDMERGLFPKRPSESLRFEMNSYIRKRLHNIGYNHVTDHVFSKNQSGSDYYRLLWGGGFGEHRAQTLAIGASARGYIAGYSYANTLAHDDYMEQVEQGNLPIFKVSNKLQDARNRGVAFFPKFFKIDSNKLRNDRHACRHIQALMEAGFISEGNGVIELTDEGKDWIPNITVDFFEKEQKEIHDIWIDKLNSNFSNRVTL